MQQDWEESVRYPGVCLTLSGICRGSSAPGPGLHSQPLVAEGRLVLLFEFFHCGKSRLSNCASWSVLKSAIEGIAALCCGARLVSCGGEEG